MVKEPAHDALESQIRQMALVDRVLGLEAEVARLSALGRIDEIERLRRELSEVYSSTSWRLGSAIVRGMRLWRRS